MITAGDEVIPDTQEEIPETPSNDVDALTNELNTPESEITEITPP